MSSFIPSHAEDQLVTFTILPDFEEELGVVFYFASTPTSFRSWPNFPRGTSVFYTEDGLKRRILEQEKIGIDAPMTKIALEILSARKIAVNIKAAPL